MNHKGSPNGPPAGNAVVNVANEEVRPDLKTISKQEVDKSSAELPVNGFCRKESKDLDRAQKYILDHQTSNISPVDLQALRRKIDWRIVPIMACCYTMQFVDKVLLNVGDQSVVKVAVGVRGLCRLTLINSMRPSWVCLSKSGSWGITSPIQAPPSLSLISLRKCPMVSCNENSISFLLGASYRLNGQDLSFNKFLLQNGWESTLSCGESQQAARLRHTAIIRSS